MSLVKAKELDDSILVIFNEFDEGDPQDLKFRRNVFRVVEDYLRYSEEVSGPHIKDELLKQIFFEVFDFLSPNKIKDMAIYKKMSKTLDQYLIRCEIKEGKKLIRRDPKKPKFKCGFNQCLMLSMDKDYERCEICLYNEDVVAKKVEEKWAKKAKNAVRYRDSQVLRDMQLTSGKTDE